MATPKVDVKVTADLRINKTVLNKMLKGGGGEVSKMMSRFAKDAQTSVRKVSDQRIKHRTRRYRNSITARVTAPTKVTVEANVRYAAVLEKGSRPHPIVARRGGVLAFNVRGKTVFARRVMHPGTKAYNIIRDGVAEAGRQIKPG